MLYILDSEGKVLESWRHKDKPLPKVDISKIDGVLAGNEELSIIRNHIFNVSSCEAPAVKWYGNEAKFIYTNLSYKF